MENMTHLCQAEQQGRNSCMFGISKTAYLIRTVFGKVSIQTGAFLENCLLL